jgi:polyisoprenyl-teichoic acid--peptidoglycan teichoic acid transferase
MRRRIGFAVAALTLWVAGSIAGSLGPSAPSAAKAALPTFVIGKAHSGYTPKLDGSKPIFILALGSDARPETPVDRGLSDSIHIIAVNLDKNKVSMLGFPRDSYVPIPGHSPNKINSAMAEGGPQLTIQTVENLTGITFDYYVLTSFTGVETAVDDIGGLTMDVPFSMHDTYSHADFEPGVQTLNGRETLAFSRDRHSLASGDFGRSENQGRVLLAALTQLRKQYAKDPSVLFDYIGAGMRNVQTDMTTQEILDFAFTALAINPTHVENMVAPGTIGSVGTLSTVNLLSTNVTIYKDLADDGIVSKKNIPQSPTAGQG